MSIAKRLIISTLIGSLVAMAGYFWFQGPGVHVEAAQILFKASGIAGPRLIEVPAGAIEELSFFTDVYMEPNIENPVSRTLLKHPAANVSFWVGPAGDLGMQWGNRRLLPFSSGKRRAKAKLLPGQWHKVGFIYKKKPGTLTTYINNKRCWRRILKPVPGSSPEDLFPGSFFEWLPQPPTADLKTPCVSAGASPLLVKKALTAHHLLDLHRDFRYYHNLSVKLLILFVLAWSIVFLLWDGFRALVLAGSLKLIWLFTTHLFVFLIFGFGKAAAGYIHTYTGNHALLDSISYFYLILITGVMLFATIAISWGTRSPFKQNLFYFGGVTALLLFTITLSLLPHSPLTAPFVFNTLYSLVFSFFSGAPFILSRINRNHQASGEAADG